MEGFPGEVMSELYLVDWETSMSRKMGRALYTWDGTSKVTEWSVLGKYRQWEWPEMRLEKSQKPVYKIT